MFRLNSVDFSFNGPISRQLNLSLMSSLPSNEHYISLRKQSFVYNLQQFLGLFWKAREECHQDEQQQKIGKTFEDKRIQAKQKGNQERNVVCESICWME